jgi:murein DD-endopeptidase MepM/ murein hydrolase activator NlpD
LSKRLGRLAIVAAIAIAVLGEGTTAVASDSPPPADAAPHTATAGVEQSFAVAMVDDDAGSATLRRVAAAGPEIREAASGAVKSLNAPPGGTAGRSKAGTSKGGTAKTGASKTSPASSTGPTLLRGTMAPTPSEARTLAKSTGKAPSTRTQPAPIIPSLAQGEGAGPRLMTVRERIQAGRTLATLTGTGTVPAGQRVQPLPGGRSGALPSNLVRTSGVFEGNLMRSGERAGVPTAVMREMIRAFSWDIDFQRDLKAGDTFEVLYERPNAAGKRGAPPRLIYAGLERSGIHQSVYRYLRRDGSETYLNGQGRLARKALLRTPLDGARLSSDFGMRMHPILGYSRMHQGVDFAAPEGTPIIAAGDGIVAIAGTNGGYGEYIRVQHTPQLATAYGHLSRYAEGVRPGARVRQGQIIGYVGSTGLATGPHLHYETLVNGVQVDPASVQNLQERRLDDQEMPRFMTIAADTNRMRETLPAKPMAAPQIRP